MMPSPITWLTVPSKRCTASIIREQLHRALEVGEEHGHLLALAFQRSLRGKDAFGEMLGRIGLRRSGGPYSRGARGHWSPAPAAELFTAFVQESAGWARQRDREPTLAAQAAPDTVLSGAARALHRGLPPPRPR